MSLECDLLVSKFAFKWVNLCRYATGEELTARYMTEVLFDVTPDTPLGPT